MSSRIRLGDKQMAVLLATMTAIMPLSVDAYLPAIPALAHDLGSDIHHIEKSLSSFMFGVALGQLTGGSLSDVKGRRAVALGGLALYIVSSLAIALAQTADQLLLLRVFQAVGGGMSVVMSGAVVRDFYEGRQAAQMFAMIGIVMMAAPLAAPMLGSLLQQLGGWRLIFAFLMVYAAAVFALLWQFLPKSGGNGGRLDRHFFAGMLARYRTVLRTKPALGFLFFQAFSFSSMFVFLTESPFVYMKLYGLAPGQYAAVFACNILTMATFNRVTAWRLKRGSNAEDILLWGLGVQLAANAVMFALALFSDGLPPFALIVACAMLSVGTMGLITANTQACFMSFFKQEGGTANAVLMAGSSMIAATVGWLTTVLHNGSLMIMPSLMLCATLTGIALLWLCSR
ncbi:MAG: multidrug effflux MFS transporter, partial [Neisseria sp.]|nr:multidrug effflux MFS transporter [Neisseria sp.]